MKPSASWRFLLLSTHGISSLVQMELKKVAVTFTKKLQ